MIILLFLLLIIAVCAHTLLFLVMRARNKRRLLAGAHGVASDATDGIGISVLCTSSGDIAQIENLLSVEYAHYEVIVTLDARRHPVEAEELLARYRMIGVEWRPSGELPVEGVRSLYRSRKRCYRRLVVIDRTRDTPEGDFDAATVVASYDYVLPVREDQYLLPDAIARLVAEVGEQPLGALSLVQTRMGRPVMLLNRDVVVALGGFYRNLARNIPREERQMLWEPLTYTPTKEHNTPLMLRLTAALLLAAGCVAAAVAGWWAVTAVLFTMALVWSVRRYVALVLGTSN